MLGNTNIGIFLKRTKSGRGEACLIFSGVEPSKISGSREAPAPSRRRIHPLNVGRPTAPPPLRGARVRSVGKAERRSPRFNKDSPLRGLEIGEEL